MPQWRRVQWLYFDLPLARPGTLNAYLLAILIVGLATLLRIWMFEWVGGIYFITFFPTVLLIALLFGFGAGLLSVILSTAAAAMFIIPPRGRFVLPQGDDAIALGLFVLVGGAIVLLVGAMRVAIARYHRLANRLHRIVEQRTEELRAAQAHLAQAQKMEAIGQLTGGIAHDFNNMLAVVLGNLDMARRRLAGGRTDVSRQIDNAAEGAARAAALTQRLLAFSRRQPLASEVVETHRALAELVELLRRTLGRPTRVDLEAPRDLWPICVDPAQLEAAIVNLAVNARDAMPDGGSVRIDAANARLAEGEAALEPGDYVGIAVADTGCGMPPEVVERAIEPFFTTKEVGRGTGLGLSQVYGFARQSGGSLAIESREGEGTVVRLFLPRHSGEAPAPPREEESGPLPRARPGEIVLVVEDEDQVRRTSVEALLDLGYGVREARSGVEALAVLASDPGVTLLFTDIVMPALDGYRLADRALRQRPDLKLLYTSGYTPEAGPNGEAAPPAGPPAQLLAKPFTLDQLARAVRGALDG